MNRRPLQRNKKMVGVDIITPVIESPKIYGLSFRILLFLIDLRTPLFPPAPAYPSSPLNRPLFCCLVRVWPKVILLFGVILGSFSRGFISAHSGPSCFTLLCLPYIFCIYSDRSDCHQFPFVCPVFKADDLCLISHFLLFHHLLSAPQSPHHYTW